MLSGFTKINHDELFFVNAGSNGYSVVPRSTENKKTGYEIALSKVYNERSGVTSMDGYRTSVTSNQPMSETMQKVYSKVMSDRPPQR